MDDALYQTFHKMKMDLIDKSKEQHVKYVYYLIALCVSSIGYSVYRTVGHSITASLIPWAFSLSSWGYSVYIGLKFLRISLNHLDTELKNLILERDLNKNLDPITRETFSRIKTDTERELINSESLKRKSFQKQTNWFFVGIALFIIWHILEMYLGTKGN